MMSGKFLRKFLISGVAVGSSDKVISSKCDQMCRASELPIYIKDENLEKTNVELCPPKQNAMESAIGSMRKQIWSIFDSFKVYRKQTEDYMNEGSSKASSLLTYLSEESDDKTRVGAVGLGALTGYVLGMRGGLFRRLVYSGTAAIGMCAICYPSQTKEYSQAGIVQSRKYATIAYNFIYGVNGSTAKGKEGDGLLLPEFPKLPSTLGEVWDIAGQFGKSATTMITGRQKEQHDTGAGAHQKSEDITKSKQ